MSQSVSRTDRQTTSQLIGWSVSQERVAIKIIRGSNSFCFAQQTGRGWFENQTPKGQPRPSYGANIWRQRQEKQQFLAELQPCNQNDEELQLQMALELSKKQAEIDAQQRYARNNIKAKPKGCN